MRLRYTSLLLFLLIALPVRAQWAPIGPSQTTVSGTAYSDGMHYMATTDGLFLRATDADAWTPITEGLPEPHIETMALSDDGLYAFLGTDGFWFRNGTTWEQRSDAANGTSLTVHGTALFVLHDDAVWTSTDGGASWAETATQPDPGNVNNEPKRLTVSGDYLFVGMTMGVWRSNDDGATWAKTDAPSNGYVTTDPTTGTVYTTTSVGGSRLYRSTDHGATWSSPLYTAPLGVLIGDVAAKGDDIVIVAGSLQSSTDGGATFIPLTFAAAYPRAPVFLSADAGGFYLNYSLVTYRSDDGRTWEGFGQGLAATNDVIKFTHSQGTLFALTGDQALHSAAADDPEFTPPCWTRASDNQYVCLAQGTRMATVGDTFYLSAGTNWTSTNGGATLESLNGGLYQNLASDGVSLYGMINTGFYRADLTAEPLAWIRLLDQSFSNTDQVLGKITAAGDVLIVSVQAGTHFSFDGGATWAFDNQRRNVPSAVAGSRAWIGSVYTDDQGVTFTAAPHLPADAAFLGIGDVLFAGGKAGVFISRDKGDTWTDISGNFPAPTKAAWAASALFHDEQYLYASLKYNEGSGVDQGMGLWRRSLAELNVATPNEAGTSPVDFGLEAHPSPFGRTLTATITLAEAGPVRLRLFDLLGREVAVLTDGVLPASSHTFRFDGDGLPAGLYLLRLETPAGTLTRKVVRLN